MRIFLVRHGESLGNIDMKNYNIYHDSQIPLTKLGQEQAIEAGCALKDFWQKNPDLKNQQTRLYYSPLLRTQQTKEALLKGFDNTAQVEKRENSLIREHDKGLIYTYPEQESQAKHIPHHSAHFNRFYQGKTKGYITPPMGESGLDVVDRVHLFKNELMRAHAKGIQNFIVVSHAKSILSIEMDFFHHSVDWLNNAELPKNCEVIKFEGEPGKGNFTRETIHISKQRPKHSPKDYKTEAVGQESTYSRIA